MSSPMSSRRRAKAPKSKTRDSHPLTAASCAVAATAAPTSNEKHEQDMADLIKHMSFLTARQKGPEAMQEWMEKYDSSPKYKVLPREVRHELDKYFFDVRTNPSRSELKQLYWDLLKIDSSGHVTHDKIVRWFQNKRQYMRRRYGRPAEVRAWQPEDDLSSRSKSSSDDDSQDSDCHSDSVGDEDD